MGYSVTQVGGPGTATPVRDWLVQSSAAEAAGGEAISRPGFTAAGWYAGRRHAR